MFLFFQDSFGQTYMSTYGSMSFVSNHSNTVHRIHQRDEAKECAELNCKKEEHFYILHYNIHLRTKRNSEVENS